MYIRSENSQGNVPPAVPVNLGVTVASSSALTLNWTDSASTEYGYVVARSIDGGPWNDQYQTLGANADSFTDSGLSPGTTYIYWVAAYNSAGNSAWSEEASASTTDKTGGALSLSITGYKRRGVHHADLAWSGSNTVKVDIYRDLQLLVTVQNSGSYTDNTGAKGSASYSYNVCEHTTSICSNAVALNTSTSPDAGAGDVFDAGDATASGTAGGGGGSISASLLLFIGLPVIGFRLMSRCINRRRTYNQGR